ncbi:hypothetical protein ZWY2020_016959, partial [Hordeum vulgare]
DHIHYVNGGREVQLSLDKTTGTGFQTRGSYLFGHFSMHIKLVGGDSAGTVTAFTYAPYSSHSSTSRPCALSSQNSEHDEIDFEFLGNRTEQPYILQTNVFSGGKGDREQRIYLWFDPTKDYHSYSVLWNLYMIAYLFHPHFRIFTRKIMLLFPSFALLVTNEKTTIGSLWTTRRSVFKNSKDLGVRYPFDQPMKFLLSLWNADDWATWGGREDGLVHRRPSSPPTGASTSTAARRRRRPLCATQGARWWISPSSRTWTPRSTAASPGPGSEHTIYNYCTDRERYAAMSPGVQTRPRRLSVIYFTYYY